MTIWRSPATRGLVLAVLCLAALAASDAQGFYGNGATIVSASLQRQEQGDDATRFAAISSNGRYVAFDTSARNLFADDDPDPPGRYRAGGVFRRDLEGGGLELVADGELRAEGTNELERRGAVDPSISDDGRYVAFSSAWRHVPADTNDNVDVYVRDMNVPIRSAGAFELVSARTGGTTPAAYGPPSLPRGAGEFGADASRGVALSSDGRKVVFRTLEVSDLPASAGTDTPPLQLFMRDLDADTTTLITRTMGSGEPAGGAVGSASISGDGTTAAWTGRNAAAQTPFLNGEFADPPALYYLWRRVSDGPSAPTRRITGLVDPEDPGCPAGAAISQDTTSTGPCYGPLTDAEQARASIFGFAPQMSEDGRKVAFATAAGFRPTLEPGARMDVFLSDMSTGITRKAGTTELTREGGDTNDQAQAGPIDGIALSRDASRLALTTTRTNFVLPTFRFLGARRSQPVIRDVYVIDLRARTLERATRAVNGGETNGDVGRDVTLSRDGSRVAFSSVASNMLFGDANERADAFVISLQPEPVPEPPPPEPPPTPPPVIENPPDPPELSLRAQTLRDGSVRLLVTVPGPGRVAAEAKGTLPARTSGKGKRKPKPKPQTFARRAAAAPRAGRMELRLKPAKRFRGEVRRKGGLRALTTVSFTPTPAGRRLTGRVRVTFAVRTKKAAKPKRPKRAAGATAGVGAS